MNLAVLVGNLTRDGELRTTKEGNNVYTFTLAVSRKYQKEDQNKEADFINCTSFGKTAETMAKYLKKGSKVLIEGRIQVKKYVDGMNETKYKTSVVVDEFTFLDKKEEKRETKIEVEEEDINDMVFTDNDLPF